MLIGAVLFTFDKCSTWNSNRKIENARKDVSAALSNLANAQANLTTDRIEEARRVEDVKVATNTLLEAQNASEEARTQTNATLANLSNAINANRPVGTTAEDLERRLNELDK